MLLFIIVNQRNQKNTIYFKTSHVIVYLLFQPFCTFPSSFQNISCYCLSQLNLAVHQINCISKHLMLLFISSGMNTLSVNVIISKHLMLLFIVKLLSKLFINIQISKHLMLLFISMTMLQILYLDLFQNISCYCLSYRMGDSGMGGKAISKHLMLLFIGRRE